MWLSPPQFLANVPGKFSSSPYVWIFCHLYSYDTINSLYEFRSEAETRTGPRMALSLDPPVRNGKKAVCAFISSAASSRVKNFMPLFSFSLETSRFILTCGFHFSKPALLCIQESKSGSLIYWPRHRVLHYLSRIHHDTLTNWLLIVWRHTWCAQTMLQCYLHSYLPMINVLQR